MSDVLTGTQKELWIEYQNSEAKDVASLTYDELNERIAKWESIEFEARAKRQKSIAEKRSRDITKSKAERDSLISDPHYTPKDSPSTKGDVSISSSPKNGKKESKPRLTKEEKLKLALGDLGVDLGDLLSDIKKK
jgi:hypothetical protein